MIEEKNSNLGSPASWRRRRDNHRLGYGWWTLFRYDLKAFQKYMFIGIWQSQAAVLLVSAAD